MSKSSTLSGLAQKLNQKKHEQIEEIEQIESEKLRELSERLNRRLNEELNTTGGAIIESIEKLKRAIIKKEKGAFAEIREPIEGFKEQIEQIEELQEQLEEQIERLQRSTLKKSIYSILFPLFLLAGMGLGAWSLGAYTAHQLREITDREKEIEKLAQIAKKAVAYKPISRIWKNGIELKPGFKAKLEETEDGGIFISIIKE